MDFLPQVVDGALVLNLKNACTFRKASCEACTETVLYFHNWIKHIQMEYLVFDFLDEKDICPGFLEELYLLKKRLPKIPFIFVGLAQRPQIAMDHFLEFSRYPYFVTPEDAVRALRIQHPGLTESQPKEPISYGKTMIDRFKHEWVLISGSDMRTGTTSRT